MSKGIHDRDGLEDMGGLLAGFTPWHSQLASMKISTCGPLGLQTSPQHVPLPRVLRPHREGHTFWHQITGRTRWSYFVPVTVCTQHTESAQASQFSPNIIAQLSANRSQLESIPVCIFIFGQLLLTERVPCIQFVQRHNLSQFITILRFGLVSLVCPHIV